MTFLIFVAAFVALACLVVPLLMLALFATLSDSAQTARGTASSAPAGAGAGVREFAETRGEPAGAMGQGALAGRVAPGGRPIDFSVPRV